MAKFSLPPLPYAPNTFAEAISANTFAQHHDGHHKGYVDKVNDLADKAGMGDKSLVDIIRARADAKPEEVSKYVVGSELFLNAAQHFNHAFYWQSLAPDGGEPSGDLKAAIDKAFGSLGNLKSELESKGAGHFGSGWVWLVSQGGALKVIATHDAQTPVIDASMQPLLTVDVWEHAYYLDHQRARAAYLKAVVDKHLNWAFAAKAYAAKGVDGLGLGIGNG